MADTGELSPKAVRKKVLNAIALEEPVELEAVAHDDDEEPHAED